MSHYFKSTLRHLTTKTPQKPIRLSKIPWKYKPRVILQAQQALTDYLHSTSTRSLPYTYAEHISSNARVSLSNLIASITFSPSSFSKDLHKFLRYHPINELEFFYESIGLDYNYVRGFLPNNKFFFSEDGSALDVACALSGFGFPWNKLGVLYREEGEECAGSVFLLDSEVVMKRVLAIRDLGFSNTTVIGICLAFPYVLKGDLEGEIGGLFDDLKRVFIDFDLGGLVEGNVDSWFDVCRKIRVFYDLGCKKGKIGELLGRNKQIFVDYSEEDLAKKVKYFCKLGVEREEVGLLLLRRPDIFGFDLETPVVSVAGLLSHFGMQGDELESVGRKYPHVMGRNKMANLCHVMRAMDLQEWFFYKLKAGHHHLLDSYAMSDPDEDIDNEYSDGLKSIRISRYAIHTLNKLDFVHAIGFGENAITTKVLAHLHGSFIELQDRFDCLLRAGIIFSRLCMMIRTSPKILNQHSESLELKVNYLCEHMGSSLSCLDDFPAFLCFNLEKRIRPRYKFHMWLTEKGLSIPKYSIASMVATSEKNFIHRVYGIHPAAPKHWFESFLPKEPG